MRLNYCILLNVLEQYDMTVKKGAETMHRMNIALQFVMPVISFSFLKFFRFFQVCRKSFRHKFQEVLISLFP